MRIALYEPDIPQNTGTILRLAACLGVEAHIIEPAGFPVSDRAFRRAGMDYLDAATIVRHADWTAFEALAPHGRRAACSAHHPGAHLVSRSRLPDRRHSAVRPRIGRRAGPRACGGRFAAVVPIRSGMRSLNVAVAAAMVLGEALRQLEAFPAPTPSGQDEVPDSGG